MTEGRSSEASARLGPPLFAFVFLAALTGAPYLRAALAPPAGTTFTGAFYFTNDVYHYLSYVEQAEGGALLFRNKLALEPHAPGLVNVEWLLAGRLSSLIGRRPMLAWRLWGPPAALALVLLADAWLRRAGLPRTHRFPALLLVFLGGGLGGLFYAIDWPQGHQPLDVFTGIFPFIEVLANPHFVVGTSLVAGSLLALSRGTSGGTLAGVAMAALVGIVRPYDLVIVVVARAVAVALTEPAGRWLRRTLPLLGVLPVVLYDYWVFYVNPAFRVLSTHDYAVPLAGRLLLAVGPAIALALGALRCLPAAPEERGARAHLWAWVLAAAGIVALRPLSYSVQFLAGVGLPLLALAAIGLSRFRPWATLSAVAALSSTAVAALWIVTRPDPRWFVPPARIEAARPLRQVCSPGDVVLAPREVGLYALAFSPCSAYVSHPVMPDFERRMDELRSFYSGWDAATRNAFLERNRIAALVLPGEGGPEPIRRLGPGTDWRLVEVVRGPGEVLSIYGRRRDSPP